LTNEELASRLVARNVVQRGRYFVLRSGEASPVYVNLRHLCSEPLLTQHLASALVAFASERGLLYDRVADVPRGSTLIVFAMSLLSGVSMLRPVLDDKRRGNDLPVWGDYTQGQRVLVVDDVATDGESLARVVWILRDVKLVVEDALVVVTRQGNAFRRLKDIGVRLHHLFTLPELLAFDKPQPPA